MIHDCTTVPSMIELIYFDSEPGTNQGASNANEHGTGAPGDSAGAAGGEGSSKGNPNTGEDQAKLEQERLAQENANLLKEVTSANEKISFMTKKIGNLGGQKGDAEEFAKIKNDPEYARKFLAKHHQGDAQDPFNAQTVIDSVGQSEDAERIPKMLAGISGQINTAFKAQGSSLNQAEGRLSRVEDVLSEARLAVTFTPELQVTLNPFVERNNAAIVSGALSTKERDYMAALQELTPQLLDATRVDERKLVLEEIAEKTKNQVMLGKTYATGRPVDASKEVSAATAIARLSKVRR